MSNAYRIDGPPEAPVLVLLNSLGTTAQMWDPQVPALSARFRVVRIEHRGHGGAAAPAPGPYSIAELGRDVLEVLGSMGAESFSVCGLSLGGMVAMWLAANHPERVESLVVACSAAELGPASAWQERAAAVRAHGVRALGPALLGRWFTPGYLDGHPGLAETVLGMLEAASTEGYAGCCEAIGAMDLRAELARITAPTLLIAGAQDPVTPPAKVLETQQLIAGSAMVVIPHAAHLANIEQPAPFTDALLNHLAGPPASRGESVRRAVLGDAHVNRSSAQANAFNSGFLDMITSYAWGEIWTRPGLDRKTRSAITLAVLTALGHHGELELHLRGAIRNGWSEDEIAEMLMHTAVYAGVPAANAAFAVAKRVLAEDPADW